MKVLENGVLRDATPEEIAQRDIDLLAAAEDLKASMRVRRNQLLAETDWTQVADVPQAIKDKWLAYRQALRNVPAQAGFPTDIDWPVKPE